jgi:predicted cupin superfamily sugar epimerase
MEPVEFHLPAGKKVAQQKIQKHCQQRLCSQLIYLLACRPVEMVVFQLPGEKVLEMVVFQLRWEKVLEMVVFQLRWEKVAQHRKRQLFLTGNSGVPQ